MNILIEGPEDKDELISTLTHQVVNLRSLAPALTLANRAIEKLTIQNKNYKRLRRELETENTRLRAAMDKWSEAELLAKPVGYVYRETDYLSQDKHLVGAIDDQTLTVGAALYTHPQPERKPLGDAKITEIIDSTDREWHSDIINDEWAMRFARAIERAHGIGEVT